MNKNLGKIFFFFEQPNNFSYINREPKAMNQKVAYANHKQSRGKFLNRFLGFPSTGTSTPEDD
jgi:hypothetical protein